jgi:hypothetical protein
MQKNIINTAFNPDSDGFSYHEVARISDRNGTRAFRVNIEYNGRHPEYSTATVLVLNEHTEWTELTELSLAAWYPTVKAADGDTELLDALGQLDEQLFNFAAAILGIS